MKVSIISAFPEFIKSFLSTSIVGRAVERGLLTVEVIDLRNFGEGGYRQIDDYSFGGDGGMVLMADPLKRALNAITAESKPSKVLYPTPQGAILTQDLVESLALEEHLIILCGHYEGVDERFTEHYVDMEISIGDYVLTGGELPTMVLVDAISRLIPGVVGKERAVVEDSFYDGMLDTSHFTRPNVWEGHPVPEVLLSGHDKNIKRWRKMTAASRTLSRRPDLLSRANIKPYLDGEVYMGILTDPKEDSLKEQLPQLLNLAQNFGIAKIILAPKEPEGLTTLRETLSDLENSETLKIVPSLSKMIDWAGRKGTKPFAVQLEAKNGHPWLEVKRQMLEYQGPTLLLSGLDERPNGFLKMRPVTDEAQNQTITLPLIASLAMIADRFFGNR